MCINSVHLPPVSNSDGALRMTVSILTKDEIYAPHNIRIGLAELIAVSTANGIQWMLPGNGATACKDTATRYAERLDRMIQGNLGKIRKSLV